MRLLITGGTGSLGRAIIRYLTEHNTWYDVSKIIVFSRDEWKQSEMAKEFAYTNKVQYFLGDVRDRQRLEHAFRGVDVVIHAAALKRVDAVAYNPTEVILTNVTGTQNVLDAAICMNVRKVMVVSSDKACEPVNIYGKSKAIAEELAVSYNTFGYPQHTAISAVRYGNVLTSRGSAYHLFKACAEDGRAVPITNLHMTRFALSLQQATQFVLRVLETMRGGEVFIPKLPTMRIVDLAKAVAPECMTDLIGKRGGGEKLHEAMISRHEADRVKYEKGFGWFVLEPVLAQWGYVPREGTSVIDSGADEHAWDYVSGDNAEWLSVEQIRELIETGGCRAWPRMWIR